MRRLLLLLCCATSATAAELKDLLRYVPVHMNTVAVVNVREINKSPRAIREGWAKNHETEYLGGALAVPPWADVVVISAELFPGYLAEGRTLALVPVNNTLTSAEIAKREGGTSQLMGGKTVILSPRRGYVAIPTPGIVGVSSTVPRQEFARWVSQPQPTAPVMSKYLQEALASKSKAPIAIAVDMAEMFDPQTIRIELLRGGIAKDDPSLDSLVAAISNLIGLEVTVGIDDSFPVEIQLDFKQLLDSQAKALLPRLPKILDICGLDIPELSKSQIIRGDKIITLKTSLSDSSLRRMLSFVHAPSDAAKSSEGGELLQAKDSAALSASMRYYRTVNTYLDDLRVRGGANVRPNDYTTSAVWYETFANKIDKLSIENVDPELVQYGASTSSKLRSLAGSLRGLKVQLDAYDSYKSVTTTYSSGSFVGRRSIGVIPGDVSMDSNVSELSSRQAELVVKLAPEREKIWQVLATDRSSVRRSMLEKYKIDFDKK